MRHATKLSEMGVEQGGVRKATAAGFGTVWTITGRKGLYQFVQGCKKDTAPAEGAIVCETGENQYAMFKPDVGATQAIAEALKVTNPHLKEQKDKAEAEGAESEELAGTTTVG